MFGFRRFPIFGWLLVAWLVFALVRSAGAGAAAGIIGFGLFLPLFLLKMMFFFMLFGFVMNKVGGGGRWHDHGDRQSRGEWRRTPNEPVERRDPEWDKNVRDAREELDEMFPDGPIETI